MKVIPTPLSEQEVELLHAIGLHEQDNPRLFGPYQPSATQMPIAESLVSVDLLRWTDWDVEGKKVRGLRLSTTGIFRLFKLTMDQRQEMA